MQNDYEEEIVEEDYSKDDDYERDIDF